MIECKRCGATQIVKSGMVRGKQRYLCKQCGCHFVEGDGRETSVSSIIKLLCAIFEALGVKQQYREIGGYLKRDPALIYRWMNEGAKKYNRRGRTVVEHFWNAKSLYRELKQDGLETGGPMLMADNIIDDLYIAVIVQRREKR